jgi:hypothetical protein
MVPGRAAHEHRRTSHRVTFKSRCLRVRLKTVVVRRPGRSSPSTTRCERTLFQPPTIALQRGLIVADATGSPRAAFSFL